MKRTLVLTLLLLQGFSLQIFSAEKESQGELSLPWTAFQKMLDLDQDNIALGWKEFQRILQQTGVEKAPKFEVQNGEVILSRDEFKKLLDKMKPPSAQAPKHFLTRAVYSGKIGKKITLVTAKILLQIPTKKNRSMDPLRIKLFPGNMAFRELLLNGKPALIENDRGWMYLTVTEPGNHQITASFSAQGATDKSPHRLSFSVPKTPITQLEMTLPIRNVDVKVDNAAQVEETRRDGNTRIKASLPATENITMSWNPITPEKAKGPAKVYPMIYNLISIEEDALRVRTRLELDVLQNTINALNLKIPEGYNVIDVTGDSVGEWKVQGEDNPVLVIPLKYARKGKFNIQITAEKVATEKHHVVAFEGFQLLNAVRERGFVAVENKSTAEVSVVESEGLNRMDIREIPASLLNLSERPVTFGFRYLRHPYQLKVEIERHEEVAVISTVVDEANGVSLILEDGKEVHNFTYKVRNSWMQFLELELPKEAVVWSTFVQGQRVKPSKNSKGFLLIPLNRSKSVSGNLSGFDVELMYYLGSKPLRTGGKVNLNFPIPQVVVSQMLWSVYFPVSHDYLYMGGDVDREEKAEGFKPLLSVLRGNRSILKNLEQTLQSGELYGSQRVQTADLAQQRVQHAKKTDIWQSRGSFKAGQAVQEASYARQVERELNFFNKVQDEAVTQAGSGGTVEGVLPIRISVPSSGQVYRFTKRIIVDPIPLKLESVYIHRWVTKVVKILVVLALLGLLYQTRSLWTKLKSKLNRHRETVDWCKSPVGFVVVSLMASIFFYFVARLLFVLAFLMFIVALGRLGWVTLESRRKKT